MDFYLKDMLNKRSVPDRQQDQKIVCGNRPLCRSR